ncbi:hypothetical protein EDC94DRAFT_645173 [Helicostylum pulchrum]|nr:hypothetical protein EDC94DRAFT_645173 [Helicostylum pulchrum]
MKERRPRGESVKRLKVNPPSVGSTSGGPPDNPQPDPTVNNPKSRYFNRKCKLSPLLKEPFKNYKDLFREIAENYSNARHDTINFGLLTVIRYLGNEQLNSQNNYARDMTTFRDVQASMIKFSEQLTLAQAQLNGMQAVIAATVNPVAQVIQDAQCITEDITNVLIQVGEIGNNFLITEINGDILNITLRVKIIVKRCLTHITTLRDILLQISNIGPLYRQVLNQLLQDIFNQLPDNARLVINEVINRQTDINIVNNMIQRLNRSIAGATNNNERAQLIQARVVMLANVVTVNERYRAFAAIK